MTNTAKLERAVTAYTRLLASPSVLYLLDSADIKVGLWLVARARMLGSLSFPFAFAELERGVEGGGVRLAGISSRASILKRAIERLESVGAIRLDGNDKARSRSKTITLLG